MAAAELPTPLHERLDDLAQRVRKARRLKAVARAAFRVPMSAFACILLDAYLGLPTPVRAVLLALWGLLILRETFNIYRAATRTVDLEDVASAVEQEFPRLAERLTTAVELSRHADVANGSPALIREVIRDADVRARKLDLAAAFPTGPALASCIAGLLLVAALIVPAVSAPRGGEHLRRFFIPGYNPKKKHPFDIVVTSGDPAVKRGDAVPITAYVKPRRDGVVLPTSATAIVTVNGREERLAMQSDEANVWHVLRSTAEGDFEYRVEAGGAESETHRVSVVEPITLAAGRATILPPAYAVDPALPPVSVEGLGELAALQHSTIRYEFTFSPRPTAAWMEFTPEPTGDAKPTPQRYELAVAVDGTTSVTVPARTSGTFALVAEGAQNVRSEFPGQPLRVVADGKPSLPRVVGLSGQARKLRPTDPIVVECSAADDVAVSALVLEWQVDDGPVRTMPFEAKLPASRVEGRVSLSLAGKVDVGQKVRCRVAVTDNRNLPEHELTPQTTHAPVDDWSEFTVDATAAPLGEQDIEQARKAIDEGLKKIRTEVAEEWHAADLIRRGTAKHSALSKTDRERVSKTGDEIRKTGGKLDALAATAAATPSLAKLGDGMKAVADRELADAEGSLRQAGGESKPEPRNESFRKSAESLDGAMRKIDDLIKANDELAKRRIDQQRLDALAREQKELAEKAKTADLKEAADLLAKQRKIEEELAKLRRDSEALKAAANAVASAEAAKDAQDARKLAEEMAALDQAIRETEKGGAQEKIADILKRQDELAKKAKELADKTDAASRIGQVPPLKPDDAEAARKSLEQGKLDEALQRQEQARQELERLARDLEQAAAETGDPRETARQLSRLQEDLRARVAQETKDTPLDKVPAERRGAFERQQEAIAKAAARIPVPMGDASIDAQRGQAAKDAADAKAGLAKADAAAADQKMQAAAESLDRLADKLPTKEQRSATAKSALADIKSKQDSLREQADAAAKSIEKQDPDAAKTQADLSAKLAAAAKQQQALAERMSKIDPPGQEARRDKAAAALKRAADDMAAGRPQDVGASQQRAKRELERLEQAMNGETPSDDKISELAARQKEVAAAAAENLKFPDKTSQQDVQRRQAEIARELPKLHAPEAAAAQAEATEAARKAETAATDLAKPDELAKRTKEAAEKLDALEKRMNGGESPAETAKRLADRQQANAERQEQKPDNPTTGETRRQAGSELEELKHLRTGPDAQKAKQQAEAALNAAKNAIDPAANTKAQKDAAAAMKQLSDQLAKNPPEAEAKPPAKETPEIHPDLPSKAQAQAARDLAEEQKKLQEEARQAMEELAEPAGNKGNPLGDLAKQQQAIADDAKKLGETTAARQGAGSEPAKQAKAAADAARQAAEKMTNGDMPQAKPAGEQAAAAMTKMGSDPSGGESAEKAKDLARRQQDVNAKLAEMSKDSGAARAQQSARQQELGSQAEKLADRMAGREGTKPAGESARESAEKMEAAREAGKKGQSAPAGEARKQAADSMRQAAKQAGEASGQGSPGSAQAGQAMDQAKGEMDKAGEQLQGGKPSQAGASMEKAAESLRQASEQLGSKGEPKPGQGGGGKESGSNLGGPGGKLDLRSYDAEVAAHTGKAWGELPGEIKNKLMAQMRARYGEDYARNIKLYFEQLAERK